MMLTLNYEEDGKTVRIEVEQQIDTEEIRGDDKVVRRVGVGGEPIDVVLDRMSAGMKATLGLS